MAALSGGRRQLLLTIDVPSAPLIEVHEDDPRLSDWESFGTTGIKEDISKLIEESCKPRDRFDFHLLIRCVCACVSMHP
jgi:hypothetical protein